MLMRKPYLLLGFISCLLPVLLLQAQRSYRDHSVLASGNWFQISVQQTGIYKVDLAFLQRLGLTGNSIPSGAIRLHGYGGAMLPEDNASAVPDDLPEVAIWMEDGGDGSFNGADYFLFYAEGPDSWRNDSLNRRFRHQRHLFSRSSYYYISIQGTGTRVNTQVNPPLAAQTVTRYDARYFHELDTINFLASGREWYGEEFAEAPGKTLLRSFAIDAGPVVPNTPAILRLSCIARSVGASSRFELNWQNNSIGSLSVLPTGAGQYDLFAREAESEFSFAYQPGNLQMRFVPGSFNAQGWLNWFEWFTRNELRMEGTGQLSFRDWLSVGSGPASFELANTPASLRVWDITDVRAPVQMLLVANNNGHRFVRETDRLREYIAFDPALAPAPVAKGALAGQDLHGSEPVDYIIICHPSLQAQAERLATLHRQRQSLRVKVATTEQVYHEFASGRPDPVALRNYVKMYYDKYGQSADDRLQYLLLLGDASYDNLDRLSNNTNLVPAWQNGFSLDVLATYASDDFFGFLEDEEDINSGLRINDLDIGIGRIPAASEQQARQYVDKVEKYLSSASLGPWRTQLGFVADDEDQNQHLIDAEAVTTEASRVAPGFDIQKIYLDAFPQQANAGGSRYPQVNQAIDNQIMNGNLIWSYSGHGGPRRLADETILDQSIVDAWQNENRLPLFLTATCDFAPFDNPLVPSLGENILLRARTGAIALLTTTRIVFSYSNRVMHENYIRYAMERDANGRYRSLGEAIRAAKNYTYQTSGDLANNRKFTLLGDPALSLAFPQQQVLLTRVNGRELAQADTLRAAEEITMEGEVRNLSGQLLSDFDGTLYASVYDKIAQVNTLGNDASSPVTAFQSWNQLLFKGKASVRAGRFQFQFKVPKDIRYQPGLGRVSLYAEDGNLDAMGMEGSLLVGGSSSAVENDTEGPDIRIYLNDTKFVQGGTSNEKPLLLLELADSSGINTLGTGIGHDLTVMIDNDPEQLYVLNEYYEAELDSYRRGKLRFQLPRLEPGFHSLKVKAWDAVNNSSEASLDFVVAADEELVLSHVLNYPNPFTTRTQFWFEHNQPGQELWVRLQVFTLTGRVIKTFQKTINTPGNRSSELEWDGRDEFGDKVARGVYLYRLTVTAPGKKKKEKIEKLVIF